MQSDPARWEHDSAEDPTPKVNPASPVETQITG